MIYDADEMLNFTYRSLRKEGLPKLTFIGINARRQEKTARKRMGYDNWRIDFDKLQDAQRKYS